MAPLKKRLIRSTLILPLALAGATLAGDLAISLAEPLPAAVEGKDYNELLNIRHNSREALEIRLLSGPDGLRVSPGGRVSWQPGFDDAGSYTLQLQLVSGETSESLEVQLVVNNTNRPPFFTSRALTSVAENQPYQYRFNAVDPDGDNVTVSVTQKPDAMAVDGDTLRWQTGFDDAGVYLVELLASDGQENISQRFSLTVQNVNRLPEIAAIDAGALVTRENEDWSLPLAISDADGDKIALSLQDAPKGMTLQGNTLSWRPDFEQAGQHDIRIKAADAEGSSLTRLSITVENVNRLPHFISQPETQLTETDSFRYDIRAFDADQTFLQYQLVQGPENASLSGSVLTWQTGYEDAGTHPFVISASDGESTVEQRFELSVKNLNRPPVFRSTPVTSINETDSFDYLIDAIDPDGEPVRLEILALPPEIRQDGNRLLWQTDYRSAGQYPVKLRAHDSESHTDQAFTLVVNNINHKPEITSTPPLKAIEAIDYRYEVSATDIDEETLSFSLAKAPEGMRISGPVVLWRPGFDAAGTHEVVVAVSDGIDTVQQAFVIDVADTNREPVLAAIDNQQVYAGDTFRLELQASDPEGDDVSLELVRHPDGMRLKRGQISWRTRAGDIGEHTIIVSASDGDLRVRKHFVLSVVSRPEKP